MPPLVDLHNVASSSPQPAARRVWTSLLVIVLTGCFPLRPSPETVPVPVPAPVPIPAPISDVPGPAAAPAVVPEPPPLPPPPVPRPDPADVVARQFLVSSDRMRSLGNAELVREVVRLSEGPPSPSVTLEMALGLGLTRNPGDVPRAIGILDPLARSSSPDLAPWQPWARLLLARYIEQRRIEDQVERLAQQLREQQRRIDQLNNQVEALKAIERSMAPRPGGGPQAPPTGPGSRNGQP